MFGNFGNALGSIPEQVHPPVLKHADPVALLFLSIADGNRYPNSKVTRLDALQATAETAYVDTDGRRKLKATPVQIALLVIANFGGIAVIALITRAVKGM